MTICKLTSIGVTNYTHYQTLSVSLFVVDL